MMRRRTTGVFDEDALVAALSCARSGCGWPARTPSADRSPVTRGRARISRDARPRARDGEHQRAGNGRRRVGGDVRKLSHPLVGMRDGRVAAQVNAHGVRMRRGDQGQQEGKRFAASVRDKIADDLPAQAGLARERRGKSAPVALDGALAQFGEEVLVAHDARAGMSERRAPGRGDDRRAFDLRRGQEVLWRECLGGSRVKLLRIGAVGPPLALHLFDRSGADVRARILREGLRDVRIVAGDERLR